MQSLAELGYAGTTVSGIAERAGLTRPALAYHFTDKYQLMAAMADAIYDEMAEFYRTAVPASLNAREKVLALVDASFTLTNSTNQAALIELLLAARRDPQCGAVVAPIIEQRDRGFDQRWLEIIEALPTPRERLELLRDLVVTLHRGMNIGRSLSATAASFAAQHAVIRRLILDCT
jgi:AcrR family transcriptional regulator